MADEHSHLFCHRCGKHLTPGEGNWYLVKVQAIADPTPGELSCEGDSSLADISRRIDELLEEMKDMSDRELMEQVYHCFTMHLCGECYRVWLENPSGDSFGGHGRAG